MRAEPPWSWTNESGEHWPGPEVLVSVLGELVVQLHLPAVPGELGEVLTGPVSHLSLLSTICNIQADI